MGKLKRNIIYQTAYQMLTIILPLITSPYVSRVLGAENLGIYSYTCSIANYFVLFAMLGINNYGNRTIAMVRDDQDELNKTFSNIFAVHSLLSVIMIGMYIVYLVFMVKENNLCAVIQILYIIGALFDINWFYFGLEEFKLTVTRNTCIKIITVISIFTFVRSRDDLWKYVFIMALGSFISQSVVWLFLRKYVTFVKPSLKEMKTHIMPMLVLFIPVVAISLYKVMDKIMLGYLCEMEEVGYYENAEKAINIPNSIIGAFGAVMLPKMSNLMKNGSTNQSRKYMNYSMEYVMLLASGLSFGLCAVASDFSVVFWGNDFEACGPLIEVLAFTVPFLAFANVIRTQYLIPTRRDKEYSVSVFVGAGVNLLLNLLLIPRYGALGAAFGTLFAEIAVCVVQTLSVKKELPILQYLLKSVFFLGFGMLMFIFVKFRASSNGTGVLGLCLEIVKGVIVYGILSVLYLYFTKNVVFLSTSTKLLKKLKKDSK